MKKQLFVILIFFTFFAQNISLGTVEFSGFEPIEDKYNISKDYFDYSLVLEEFPKDFYYTTEKINKSKERILIITDKLINGSAYYGLFYYFAKNGFVYPLGCLESDKPLTKSKNYLYLNKNGKNIRFYMSDKKLLIIKSKVKNINENINVISFNSIKSADKFIGEYGEPAGDDVGKEKIDGFYYEYHKLQYKKSYIKNYMKECILDGVKTNVQLYCCMLKKLHP